jgi:uncharacterized protein (DUF433 family)
MEQINSALGEGRPRRGSWWIDWSQCPDVESVPGRCSGAWVAKDSRVMVEGILENAEDCSVEEVADMFELPVEQVRRILAFARQSG